MSSWLGVLIAFCANALISLGLNLQKLAHVRLAHEARQRLPQDVKKNDSPEQDERTALRPHRRDAVRNSYDVQEGQHMGANGGAYTASDVAPSAKDEPIATEASQPRLDKAFVKSFLWWAGLSCVITGELGNFAGYAFAPASLVAVLGTSALIANAVFAPLLLREPFRKKDILGVSLCILATFIWTGAVTVIYSSEARERKLYPKDAIATFKSPSFVMYIILIIFGILGLGFLSRTRYGDRHIAIDIGLCSLAGGVTVVCTKVLSGFLSLIFLDTFTHWITYPLLVGLATGAVTQVNFLNKALQRFESRLVVPTQFCGFSLSVIVASAVLFHEFEGVDFSRMLNFVFGCLVSVSGVWVLGSLSKEEEVEEVAPEPTEPSRVVIPQQIVRPRNRSSASGLSVTLGGARYLLIERSPSSYAARSTYGSLSADNVKPGVGVQEPSSV